MIRTDVNVGDVVHFKILIAYRPHRSKSKVYGIDELGVLISCNGIRKTFLLRWDEIQRVEKKRP